MTVTPMAIQPPATQEDSPSDLWMRGHYSFATLRDLVVLLREHREGLRPMQLNSVAAALQSTHTKGGRKFSPTTMYHCRRALVKLALVRFRDARLVLNDEDGTVRRLATTATIKEGLSEDERRLFSEIVINNEGCRHYFFDLFIQASGYTAASFADLATPVVWRRSGRATEKRVAFSRLDGSIVGHLGTDVEIQAILYGLRYWARDQLGLIDEFYRDGIGAVMFPILDPALVPQTQVEGLILSQVSPHDEWTVMSVREEAYRWAVRLRVPVRRVFDALIHIQHRHPDRVVLIATPRSLATLTSRSHVTAEFELRSYLRDELGRYISHVRLHRDLRPAQGGQE